MRNVEGCRVVGHLAERERRIAVGAERAVRVVRDTPRPAEHADVEVEEPARVALREEDREERDDRDEEERDEQEREDDVVRDREGPLDEPQPAADGLEAPFDPDGMSGHGGHVGATSWWLRLRSHIARL